MSYNVGSMRFPIGLLLTCSILVATPASAYQRTEVDNIPGRYLYWGVRTLSYGINRDGCKDTVANETVGAVQRAFFSWASPSCTDIYFVYDGLLPQTKSNLALGQNESPDHQNLVIWHSQWPPAGVTDAYITKDMPAVTTVIYNTDTGLIVDADIDLNAQDFFWTTTDDSTKAATDIQNIMTHEIGHLLGLAHTDEKSAVMYERTHQGELSKRTLHADDILGLCTIYPFGGTTPTGAGQGSVPQDVQGGCRLVEGDPDASRGLPFLLVALLLLALARGSRARSSVSG